MQRLSPEQLSGYLNKIDVVTSSPATPNLALLCTLHFNHVTHIPYENLSLHLTKAQQQFPDTLLDANSLYTKMVAHHRGGCCFEQNALFAAALKGLGFTLYLLSARLAQPHPLCTDKTVVVENQPHMAIGVVLEGQHWVADVGYGGKSLRLPIKVSLINIPPSPSGCVEHARFTDSTTCRDMYDKAEEGWQAANECCSGYGHRIRWGSIMETGSSEIRDEESYRASQPSGYYMQALNSKGEFQDLYFFQMHHTSFAEIGMLNWYTATCPKAAHRKKVIVAKQTALGRHTYYGKVFKVFEGLQCVWTKQPDSDEDEEDLLHALFSIRFSTQV